ncbi:MAG: AI-2E family transporter [Betaproteobacteria bacterium HGW-Betaproteobacteria-1]|jgi:predicted PurR-regulated permease PerM|nr:MAG: AI-2E family transporter [Betaproteobacteria bacterium HGW-Betaproteobacteria-1]
MTTKRENQLPDYRIVLLVAGFLVIFYLLLPIMAPFLVAAILAYICKPIVDRISMWKAGKLAFGRTLATVITMLLLVGVTLLLVLIIVPMLQKELLLMVQRLPDIIDLLRARFEPWLLQHFGISLNIDLNQIQDILSKHWKVASDLITPVLLSISKNGFAIVLWIINLLLVPVVLFYMLRDWHAIVARIAQLIPRGWYEKTAVIAGEIDVMLAEFLRGQLSVMLLMTVFYAIGLWAAGLELALPVALVAGLLGFVPYLGVTIGLLMALMAAALQFSSPGEVVPILAVFAVAQLLEGFVLTPWLVGDRIGLHPVVVIFTLMAGGQLFGFAGILLALPVGAAIAVGLRHARQGYLSSETYLK